MLCAELLSHVIRENSDIKGIEVYNKEIKLSLYADDTTIFLKPDKKSLGVVMRVLEWFKKISGLSVNKEKTKVIKIGPLRDRSITWEGKYRLKWTDEFEVLGISYNINNMGEITELNISDKIKDIKKLISVWKSRKLTPYGKVVLIKSLLYSKFTHILLSLPSPEQKTFDLLNSIVKDFLWDGKPPKFRKEIMEADTKFGGLKLHNLELFDKSLKIGWLKRYLKSKAKWCSVPDDFELYDLFKYGIDFIDRIIEMTTNPFWIDVLKSIKILGAKEDFVHNENLLLTPLWHNPDLRLQIKREWLEKGIYSVWDLLDYDRKPYSMKDFESMFCIKTNFLEYGSFCIKIKEYLGHKDQPMTNPIEPQNSYLNVIINMDKKGVSNIYRVMLGKNHNILENLSQKWREKTELDLTSFMLSKSFRFIPKIDDIYLRYIQFRTLHRRFFTTNYLHSQFLHILHEIS